MCVAADDPRVRGCALLGPRADFDDWADQPRKFLDHCRSVGSVRTPQFPKNFDEWTRELGRYRPVSAAQRFAPRPLLLLHGDDDESVPATDTRQLAESHGAAEMRVLEGAGHRLRHDPRDGGPLRLVGSATTRGNLGDSELLNGLHLFPR